MFHVKERRYMFDRTMMVKYGVMTLMVVLATVSLAHADYYVCGDATKFDQDFYREPTASRPENCSTVPPAQIDAQRALINSVKDRWDYLKVPAGLVVMKTQAEKDAVDLAIANANAAATALATERANNIFCNKQDVNAGTDAITARKTALYAQIDGIPATSPPTRATLVAALKAVVDELATVSTLTVNCFTGRKQGVQ
jgi:hypothetical protein